MILKKYTILILNIKQQEIIIQIQIQIFIATKIINLIHLIQISKIILKITQIEIKIILQNIFIQNQQIFIKIIIIIIKTKINQIDFQNMTLIIFITL